MEPVIRTINLCKTYGAKRAVDNVSMNVYRGDIYGIIGSNGAGKTTLIRMLMGLARPTSGSMELLGKTTEGDLTKARAAIGCIVETPALMLHMTAVDCLKTYSLLSGINAPGKIEQLLQLMGLSWTGKKKVKDFSLGMKQRLCIAQALLTDPQVLILDEPTNGMDPQGIIEMRQFLQRLRNEFQITILISSHILSELQQLATRFGIINNGTLIEEFTAGELADKIVLGITLEVSGAEKAMRLLTKNFGAESFFSPAPNIIVLRDSRLFKDANRVLVTGGVELSVVAKDQFNLEKYFINKVGAANAGFNQV